MDHDRGSSTDDRIAALIREKIVSLRLPGASLDLIGAVENLGRIAKAFQVRPEELAIRDVFSEAL